MLTCDINSPQHKEGDQESMTSTRQMSGHHLSLSATVLVVTAQFRDFYLLLRGISQQAPVD